MTPPEALEYRRWFLGEFTRQCRGDAPTPWPEHRSSAGEPVHAPSPSPSPPPGPPGAPSPAQHGWAVESDGTTTTVTIIGALDLVSAPALRDLLVDATSVAPITVVDLVACDFIDSVGVSVLVAALLRAEGDGAVIHVRLGDAARRILRISGLVDRFTPVTEDP